jgi:hypothetical protein
LVPETQYLKTAQITSLPPYSETDIKVTLPINRGNERNAIAKPSTTYLGHKQLVGCHCLIANTAKTTAYRVCNPTDTVISIYIYSKIAVYEPIADNTRIERWTDQNRQNITESIPEINTIANAKRAPPTQNQIKLATELQCNINTTELTDEQHDELIHLMAQNVDIFATDTTQSGITTPMTKEIHLDTDTPVCQRPNPTMPLKREVIDKHVDELLAQGTIERSNSQYSTLVVLILKAGASPGTRDHTQYYMCTDFRLINTHVMQPSMPLPRINEALTKMRQ